MMPYRIITDRLQGFNVFELVRVSDGAIIASSDATKAIIAPEWLRQLQARLNSKAVLDKIL